MRFLFRLIPSLLGVATLVAFVLIAIDPVKFVYISSVFFIVMIYGIFELFSRRVRGKDFAGAVTTLILFTASGIGFFLFIEDTASRFLTAFVVALLVTFFAEQLYRWFYNTAQVPSYALGVSVSLLRIFTIFFLSADLIGLRIFIGLPIWSLVPGFVILIMLLVASGGWAQGKNNRPKSETFLLGLLFGELFWVILYLPSSFQVGGALIALAWYIVIGLLSVLESGLRVRRTIGRYALVGAVLFIIIILTARWV